MKKSFCSIHRALQVAAFAWLMLPLTAAPFGPKGRPVKWTQPTGEKLELRVHGDEFLARTETASGHTVIFNPADQSYHYAALAANGKSLVPSGIPAHLPPKLGLAKGLDFPKEQAQAIASGNFRKFAAGRLQKWSERVNAVRQLRAGGAPLDGARAAAGFAPNAAPMTGDYRGLTILVQFPDDKETSGADPVRFPSSRSKIINYCNQVGYRENGNSGSVREYFLNQSIGRMDYSQKVTTIITLPNPRNYYNYSNYPRNTIFREDAGRVLLLDAIAVLKSQNFDFSGLTTDADGNALATNIFFAGPDSGVWAQGLWPHQWSLADPVEVGTTAEPIAIYNYQITNIEDDAPVIGTFIHENGHLILNYPDLYSYVNQGEGVGRHCLMGSGNYQNEGKTPAPLNAYFKDIVGWADVTDLSPFEYSTRFMPSTGNVACRLRKPGSTTEYFIVENRGNGDRWAQYAQDKGILIWHIDETIEGNSNRDFEDPHYGVALEQADGRNDLEDGANRGDTTDAYDASTQGFNGVTSPNSKWWDGSGSGVRVKVLSAASSSMKVQFGAVPPDTIIVSNPAGGEVLYLNSRQIIRWEANISGNVRIDLIKNGSVQSNIAASVPDNGRYTWNIPVKFAVGKGFKIRISSVTNPKPVSAESEGTFSISDATFPVANAMPYGWRRPADAHTSWQVTKSARYEGTHCLVTNSPPDGRKAAIEYKSDFKAGNVSFYLRTSTEVSCDHARFFIDGTEQSLTVPGAGERGLSGEVNWTFFSFPVSAGTHTFKWVYQKDDSLASGKDLVWLDAVSLPETTQEIAVANTNGQDLVSDTGLILLPDTWVGSASGKRTLTIENRGRADLYGIKVLVGGADATSFTAGNLGQGVLKPGGRTTFDISFNPKSRGLKSAEVRIASNDTDEDPFIIKVQGSGLGTPRIAVSNPADVPLKDGSTVSKFGYAPVYQTGMTRTYTVSNLGSGGLKDLSIAKKGANWKDFVVSKPVRTELQPGESTTFTVTFRPQGRDLREASIHITCNYRKAGSFDIDLEGNGVPPGVARSVSGASSSASLAEAVLGSPLPAGSSLGEIRVAGADYLSATIAKAGVPAGATAIVEVSPNLIDWFSGPLHTTVVADNETFLRVRDNTPREPGTKRFIRVRLIRR